MNLRRAWRNLLVGMIALGVLAPARASAENIKIGLIKTASGAPLFIAQDKGYFAAEGLTAELVYFDAAQPIAVALASGALDFGVGGLTGGFYSLAGQGALRIIAGSFHEFPGFQSASYVVSNRAYAAGLKSFKDFPGHTVAITQVGSVYHYSLGLLADKYKFDLSSLRLLPLQSLPNIVSAVSGGQADIGMLNPTLTMPLDRNGEAKLIGWVGDETPWQVGAVITSTKAANDRRDTVERFLRASAKASRDFHNAFTSSDGKRQDGTTAPAILAIMSKYLGQPPEMIELGIGYLDAEARLDVADILHQIAWYKSQNLVKDNVRGDEIIDKRYVVALPDHS